MSINGLLKAVDQPRENFCLACFNGEYPIEVQLEMDKLGIENIANQRPEVCDGMEDD